MRNVLDYIRKYKFLLLIILPASLLFMLIIFPSGSFFCFEDSCGINFWGAHGHDAIWHLAIANVSFKSFPFQAPTFAGEGLYGYNWLLDFFVFLLTRAGIPVIVGYFKILPIVWFFLFTSLILILGRKIKDDPIFVSLFLFFNYFAGSFYYLIKLLRYGSINDSSTQLPQPAVLMMSNLPFAFSLVAFLLLLILIKDKNTSVRNIIFAGLLIFMNMGLKFYGGMISLFLVVLYLLLTNRKIKYLLTICLFAIGSILVFYDPVKSFRTESVFGWAPFALVHTITESPNMFYLQNLTDARYFLITKGIGPRLIAIEAFNLLIFLFFYLGTRFFGLLYLPVLFLKKKIEKFDFTVVMTIFFSISLTVTLVQKAEWWNTIQFFYYAIFLLTIYLSKLTYDLIRTNKTLWKLIAVVIMWLSIPTSIDLIKFFLVPPGATYLPKEELTALEYLKKQPDGIVYAPLFNREWRKNTDSNKLYTYDDTAYIAAFSGKQLYYADEVQLRLTGIPYEERLKKMQNLDCSILKEIDYIYEIREISSDDKIAFKCNANKPKEIFSNPGVFIYSVKN